MFNFKIIGEKSMKANLTKLIFCLSAIVFLFAGSVLCVKGATGGIYIGGSRLKDNNQGMIDTLSTNNVNEVFVLVKGESGDFTAQNKLTDFITRAHEKNIKVNLVYIVLTDNYYFAENPGAYVYHCPKPGVSLRPYIMGSGSPFVNLLYPGYKHYVMDNIAWLVETYDCDGICLDNLRYTHFVYSFDPWSLKKAADLGCDTTRLLSFFTTEANYNTYAYNNGFIDLYRKNPDPDVVKWVDMRKEVISEYLTAIRDTMDCVRPGLKLSAFFMPESAETANLDFGWVHYGQDYTIHAKLLDQITPTAYIISYGKSVDWIQTLTATAKSFATADGNNCKVVTAIQTYAGIDATSLDTQIGKALDGGSDGVIINKYDDIKTSANWSIIKDRFGTFSGFNDVPSDISMLDQNFPNPFSTITTISFQVKKPSHVSLTIYDAVGRKVSTLVNENKLPGTYQVNFEAKDLSSGVYFYKLGIDGSNITRRMVLVR